MKHRSPWSLPLGQVAGISVRVHASFAVLLALVALDATMPGEPSVWSQLAWLIAVFAGVVAHELAHSLVAQAHGLRVSEIELLPIGGLSKLEGQPSCPQDALLIAAAGPAASVAIGLLGAGLAMAAGVSLWPVSLTEGAFLSRLVWVNLLLGAFNLVPALPLDGGRILRAALEPRYGHARATRVAAVLGRITGGALMAIGLFANLWFLFIGVFVLLGATSEETMLVVEQLLADVRLRDLPLDTAAPVTGLPVADVDDLVLRSPLFAGADDVAVGHDHITMGVVHGADLNALLRSRWAARAHR